MLHWELRYDQSPNSVTALTGMCTQSDGARSDEMAQWKQTVGKSHSGLLCTGTDAVYCFCAWKLEARSHIWTPYFHSY